MTLAESKRYFVLEEFWNAPSYGASDPGGDIYIANALAPPPEGTADINMIGNQIIDPMIVLRLTVTVRWGLAAASWNPHIPAYRVGAYLVAINDQVATTVTPRLTALSEDNTFFIRHPGRTASWQFNSQNVTVIAKKSLWLKPEGMYSTGTASTVSQKQIKIAKRLRGTKEYEQTVTNLGVVTKNVYLKGWNYYWIVISQGSAGALNSANGAANPNPIEVVGDRYLYFKDF